MPTQEAKGGEGIKLKLKKTSSCVGLINKRMETTPEKNTDKKQE
jgi:hypothetical protein